MKVYSDCYEASPAVTRSAASEIPNNITFFI
jgi:hypothetical protein